MMPVVPYDWSIRIRVTYVDNARATSNVVVNDSCASGDGVNTSLAASASAKPPDPRVEQANWRDAAIRTRTTINTNPSNRAGPENKRSRRAECNDHESGTSRADQYH